MSIRRFLECLRLRRPNKDNQESSYVRPVPRMCQCRRFPELQNVKRTSCRLLTKEKFQVMLIYWWKGFSILQNLAIKQEWQKIFFVLLKQNAYSGEHFFLHANKKTFFLAISSFLQVWWFMCKKDLIDKKKNWQNTTDRVQVQNNHI